MLQTDKELIKALRTLAKVMDDMSGGYGRNTAARLEAAADRIVQLAQANHDIRHLWYKGKEMCVICAHRCRNADAESCEECDLECLCRACKGENWEEANSDG